MVGELQITHFSVFPPTPPLTDQHTHRHSIFTFTGSQKAGTELRREGYFPCPGFVGQALPHRGRREELGEFFTELIGTTVLVLMFYNAGI